MNERVRIDENNNVHWVNLPYGFTIITGDTGTGKTFMTKGMLARLSRRMLIIDPKGDYVRQTGIYEYGVRNENRTNIWQNKGTNTINCRVIKEFKIPITWMRNRDFEGIGFTALQTKLIQTAIKKIKSVRGVVTISELMEYLEKHPTKDYERYRINNWHTIGYDISIREDTKQLIISKLNYMRHWFCEDETTTYNFQTMLYRNNILIQPIAEMKSDPVQLRVYFSVILNQMKKSINRTNCLVVIDEADVLIPNQLMLSGDEVNVKPPIAYFLYEYINKDRRMNNVAFILITQRLEYLDRAVINSLNFHLSGRISEDKELSRLNIDKSRGYFEMYYYYKDKGKKAIFLSRNAGCEA